MAREIKFRAWGAKDYSVSNEKVMDYNPHVPYDWNLNDVFKDLDVVLMQFTGLKDKNGKEIYEGDVVVAEKDLPENSHARCTYSIVEEKGISFHRLCAALEKDVREDWSLEVIGNIYENPELLTDKK